MTSGAVDGTTLGHSKALLPASRALVIRAGAGIKWRNGTANLLKLAEAVHQAIQDGKPAVIHVKIDPDAVRSFRRDALQKRS
jgi:thiamine pyrophosphate-dependent acetolactate synthase large subunit-like protein